MYYAAVQGSENALKNFIQEGAKETITLENAAMGLDTEYKVGILHYSPVKETLAGEEPELYPFLGSSLLGDALDRHHADVIVHDHAHQGSPRGATPEKTVVHNVSRFVQRRFKQKSYLCFDLG